MNRDSLNLKPNISPEVVKRAGIIITSFSSLLPQLENDEIDKLSEYCSALLDINEKVNLTGAKTLEDFIVKHVIDTVLATKAPFVAPRNFVDVGSGGGIPGIILSILWKKNTGTLVERRERKSLCLKALVAALGLEPRLLVENADLAQIKRNYAREDLWFRGFMPGKELATFVSELYPNKYEGRLLLMKGPRWAEEKKEIISSRNISPYWADRFVKKSKEYNYSLPDGMGERVLVCV